MQPFRRTIRSSPHVARRGNAGLLPALAIVAVGALAHPAAGQQLTGRWEGRIVYDSLTVDFPLEWTSRAGAPALLLFNGDVPVSSTRVTRHGDSVRVEFAHLASVLEGRIVDGTFTGRFGNPRRGEFRPVTAHPVSADGLRISDAAPTASDAAPTASGAAPSASGTAPAPDVSGLWFLPNESPKGERAWRFVVRQNGNELTATILRVDGDAGALTGSWHDGRFVLSHFDGTRPARLEVTPQPDGTLALVLQSTRGSPVRYTALRPEVSRERGLAEPADVATHTGVSDPGEPFRFAFPDLKGTLVSSSDARFRGKVVLVNVTGSWCPNCHDEAPFLAALYRKYRDRGLEIVGLDFEEKEQLTDLSRLNAFVAKYGIEYPYLVGGEPAEVHEKLPQAVNLNTWPATFFVGRDGRVKAVRTGFAAPASGSFHDDLERDYTSLIEGLLAQGVADSSRP